jgi:hypothetical protein
VVERTRWRERERETRLWGDGEEGLGGGMKYEGEVLNCDEVIIVWFWILQVKCLLLVERTFVLV